MSTFQIGADETAAVVVVVRVERETGEWKPRTGGRELDGIDHHRGSCFSAAVMGHGGSLYFGSFRVSEQVAEG